MQCETAFALPSSCIQGMYLSTDSQKIGHRKTCAAGTLGFLERYTHFQGCVHRHSYRGRVPSILMDPRLQFACMELFNKCIWLVAIFPPILSPFGLEMEINPTAYAINPCVSHFCSCRLQNLCLLHFVASSTFMWNISLNMWALKKMIEIAFFLSYPSEIN